MKPVLVLAILLSGAIAGAQTKRLTFEGTQAIHKFALKDLGPDFPSDWSAFEYLVMEIRTSTPQRFHSDHSGQNGLTAARIYSPSDRTYGFAPRFP